MAKIIGGITTSHIPLIGKAIAEGSQQTPYWKPFFDAYPPIHNWLEEEQPDVAIVFYNDHGLEFFLDKKPTFAIGAAEEYHNADEGWGINTIPPIKGAPELSWHICNQLVENEFDITICQEMKVDHGLTVPMQLMWPNNSYGHMKVIPVCINVEQHPMPSPKRCFDMGKALGDAIRSFDKDLKVVILGTGGLSHQLDGERAGFINTEFDRYCMDKIISEPEALTKLSIRDLVVEAGSQGPELILWLGMRGALSDNLKVLHSNYHYPISNTGAGTMLIKEQQP
ncbi:class III extradiol dioxygenase family protein (plasmid) [Photobacterium sp. DA100]|uniref:class III extradiol dioxygenase family protein n=1 Tax=Photobacterium sp. DA100 TaxID=3027472 RepID=UPI00247A924A|nr:class III extradiol dioxygenase family protein [Photobacterium sp. DA100]WEM44667.1 class III extradiol dioxygenase family protein [Photobacterium sp. DA100]